MGRYEKIPTLVQNLFGTRCRWFSLVEYNATASTVRTLLDGGARPPAPDPRWLPPFAAPSPRVLVRRLYDWNVEEHGVIRLPFMEEPSLDPRAAFLLDLNPHGQLILWLALADMPTPADAEKLRSRITSTVTACHTVPRRTTLANARLAAQAAWRCRKLNAHILSGTISNQLLLLWLQLAETLPESFSSANKPLNDIETLRSHDLEIVAQRLYPVNLEWSLLEAVRGIARLYHVPVVSTQRFRELDHPLNYSIPHWFRLIIVDAVSLVIQHAHAPVHGIRLDTHPRDRVHIVLERQPGGPVPLGDARAVVGLMGGVIAALPNAVHICLPF